MEKRRKNCRSQMQQALFRDYFVYHAATTNYSWFTAIGGCMEYKVLFIYYYIWRAGSVFRVRTVNCSQKPESKSFNNRTVTFDFQPPRLATLPVLTGNFISVVARKQVDYRRLSKNAFLENIVFNILWAWCHSFTHFYIIKPIVIVNCRQLWRPWNSPLYYVVKDGRASFK